LHLKYLKGKPPEKSIKETIWHRILANSDGFQTSGGGERFFQGATVCIPFYISKTVAFATGETVKNIIYLTINKLRIVIKSKSQQQTKKSSNQETMFLDSKPGDSPTLFISFEHPKFETHRYDESFNLILKAISLNNILGSMKFDDRLSI
jgi:hypothetical protein